MGCDGIYDKLHNMDILNLVWGFKRKNEKYMDFHLFYGNCADSVIKLSMKKLSADNVTVIFIAFKNFENLMLDNDFEWPGTESSCKYDEEEIDLNPQ